jgi:outer membrane protein
MLSKLSLGISILLALMFSYFQFIHKTDAVVYIDSGVLMTKFDSALEAKEKLEKQMQEWQTNVTTLEKRLDSLRQHYQMKSAKWSKKAKTDKIAELRKKEQEYSRYTSTIQQMAQQKENELYKPVYDELNLLIKDYGLKMGYDIILGTTAGGNILYAREGSDVTLDFLNYIEKR